MPKPNKKVQIKNIAATIPVNLFNPFSALFCEAKTCEAPPIPAIPSPFGECSKINIIKSKAEIICTVHTMLINIIFSPFS